MKQDHRSGFRNKTPRSLISSLPSKSTVMYPDVYESYCDLLLMAKVPNTFVSDDSGMAFIVKSNTNSGAVMKWPRPLRVIRGPLTTTKCVLERWRFSRFLWND